jgi:hypothetical protein
MPIRKSDDLRNDCAKSLILKVLLAQSLVVQIISTLGVSRTWKPKGRGV